MRTVLMVTILWAGLLSATAQELSLYIFDVLKRPDYRRAYTQMLAFYSNLPHWMSTATEAIRTTALPGKSLKLDGVTYEVFKLCKPHDCGDNTLVVMFSERAYAVGSLNISEHITILGHPTPDEAAALVELSRNF